MKKFYTYLHCKPDGNPFYVGKGSDKRIYRKSRKRNPYHTNILRKYGKENILVYMFPCDSEEQAFADEIQQIAQLRNQGYNLCNLTEGGEGASGQKMSESARAKIALAGTGRKHSPEVCKEISLRQSGRKLTEETKKKISIAKTKNPTMAWLGKKRSEETKRKISLSKLGKTSGCIGKKLTAEHRAKLSVVKKGKPWTEARRNAVKNHE